MPRKVPLSNHTQSPNVFYDEWIKEINSLAELKVVEVVIRNTLGWHYDRVKMSLANIKDATGLSKSSAQEGVRRAVEHGYIARVPYGKTFAYEIAVDVPESGTEQNLHIPDASTRSYRDPVPKPHVSLDRLKKVNKEIKPPVVKQPKPEAPSDPTEEAQVEMLSFLIARIGQLPRLARERNAVQWLLKQGYSQEDCERCLEYLLSEKWRTSAVTWVTVQDQIGNWERIGRPERALPKNGYHDNSKVGQSMAAADRVMAKILQEEADERAKQSG